MEIYLPLSFPTSEEFNSLKAEVATIKKAAAQPAAVTPQADPEPITITEYPGMVFQKDNSEAALRAAVNEVLDSRTSGISRKVIRMQPGTTTITNPDLLGSPTTGTSSGIFGFEIEGVGERMTTLAFNPVGGATTDPRQLNLFTLANRVRDFKMRNMQVTTNNPNASMLWSWSNTKIDANSIYPEYGVGQNQRFIFENVEWGGKWKRVIGLDGDLNTNNNSEWYFRLCNTNTTSQFGEAFFQSGGISGSFAQQTQYLNFFVHDCNFTFNGGTLFRIVKGGNLHVRGGSMSAASNANALIWFDIQGAGADSASNWTFDGTRFEPKAANQIIIRNAVGSGLVTFRNVIDTSSLQYPAGSAQSQYKLHQYIARNGRFPIVNYQNCSLVGSHLYTGANNNAPGKAIYEKSKFYQWTSDNAVATAAGATDGFIQWTGGKPRLRVEDCEGQADLNQN